jgi:hypothetical protein
MPVATAVTLDELRLLFTGDWIHDDQCWDTTPLLPHRLGCQDRPRNRSRLRHVATQNDLRATCV